MITVIVYVLGFLSWALIACIRELFSDLASWRTLRVRESVRVLPLATVVVQRMGRGRDPFYGHVLRRGRVLDVHAVEHRKST